MFGVVALLLVGTCFAVWVVHQEEETLSSCAFTCQVYKELRRRHSENIDLRVKVALLEVKLEQQKSTIEPDSRHFYDCKPTKKGEMWTLAIHSYTWGGISAYYCMSHNGHTSPEKEVPEKDREKLTCKDHKGVSYPQ